MFFKRRLCNVDFASLSSVVSCRSSAVVQAVTSTAGALQILALDRLGFPGSIPMGSSLYGFIPSIFSQYPRLKI